MSDNMPVSRHETYALSGAEALRAEITRDKMAEFACIVAGLQPGTEGPFRYEDEYTD